jgi:hypothetical protein
MAHSGPEASRCECQFSWGKRKSEHATPACQGEMTATVLFRIFTIEIGDRTTLTFEAQNQREAQELCHEQWLKDDLAEAKSGGVPLWDGKAKLRARMALPDESALFAVAKNNGQRSDGLILIYLVKLDGGEADEQPVDPGAFPPART